MFFSAHKVQENAILTVYDVCGHAPRYEHSKHKSLYVLSINIFGIYQLCCISKAQTFTTLELILSH